MLAVLELESGRVSQSRNFCIEPAEVLVVNFLFAYADLLSVAKRLGHPLLRIALLVLFV